MGLRKFIRNVRFLLKHELKTITQNVESVHAPIRKHPRWIRSLPVLIVYLDRLYRNEPAGVYGKPNIEDREATLQELINSDRSLIRFGEGELGHLENIPEPFQEVDPLLKERLIEILGSDDPRIMLCLNRNFWYGDICTTMKEICQFVWVRRVVENYMVPGKKYYNTNVTFSYIRNIDNPSILEDWYAKWRSVWAGKDVLIVCGDRVFNDIEYNIFDNAKSMEWLHVPTCNAFEQYDAILADIRKTDSHRLVILIVGPTATVLAYDLTIQDNRRCLDLGHLAQDYDAYRKLLPKDSETIKKFWDAD